MSRGELNLTEARALIRASQDKGEWHSYEIADLCGLRSQEFRWRDAADRSAPGGWSGRCVTDPVAFAAWLEQRLREVEERREREVARGGPAAVAGARSRGVNRAKLRRAFRLWTEEAQRWVVMRAVEWHTGASGGAVLREATRAEALLWLSRRSPDERSALLTLWRLGGGESVVVAMLARARVFRRVAARVGRATPPPPEPPAPSPGSSPPAHPPPPPPR